MVSMLDNILHSSLSQFMRRVQAGEYLFRQGEPADFMVFVVSGRVQLIKEKENGRYVEGVMESGQILGEKVLVSSSSYPRSHSARAETEVLLLAVTAEELAHLEQSDTGVMAELLKGILQVVADRFDKANRLIAALRHSSEQARLIELIAYFAETAPREQGNMVVFLSVDSIHNYVDMEKPRIAKFIEDLVSAGRLTKLDTGKYQVPDLEALRGHVPELTRRLAG